MHIGSSCGAAGGGGRETDAGHEARIDSRREALSLACSDLKFGEQRERLLHAMLYALVFFSIFAQPSLSARVRLKIFFSAVASESRQK